MLLGLLHYYKVNHSSSILLNCASDISSPATTFVTLCFRNLVRLMVQNFVELQSFHIPFGLLIPPASNSDYQDLSGHDGAKS